MKFLLTHAKRSFSLLVLVMLSSLLAPDARPEVRSYTVGVDVNCPTGLGE